VPASCSTLRAPVGTALGAGVGLRRRRRIAVASSDAPWESKLVSSAEDVATAAELPLAARNALLELLLRDLAGAREGAVGGALLLLAAGRTHDRDAASLGLARRALEAAQLLAGTGEASAAPRAPEPPPAWASTARTLLSAYARLLDEAPRGTDLDVRLAQARRMFERALYFEVHEVLEPPWRDATGRERTILQGIIQAAVAWHHAARGNPAGASRLGEAARVKLASAPALWHGFPLGDLRASLQEFLDARAATGP
jgi:predicted metal-dependent hydrolase